MGESEAEITQSVQKTIQVLVQARFVVNLKKSKLDPTQDLVYIGAMFCTDLGRLYLTEIQIQELTACVIYFSKVGAYKLAHQFLSSLGLMAAAL